jgi:hypothetical protein
MEREISEVLEEYNKKQEKQWATIKKMDETGEGQEIVSAWFKLIVTNEEYTTIVDALEEFVWNENLSDEDKNHVRGLLGALANRKTLPNRKELLMATGLDIPGKRIEDM